MSTKIDGVKIDPAIPTEVVRQNVLDARRSNIEPINRCLAWREGRPIAVIGGGPSLKEYLPELNKYQTNLACGSVHDYLAQNGVIPKFCILCDPDPVMAKYLINSNSFTTYLVASQCDKEVFKALYGKKVYIWHCAGDPEFDLEMFPDKSNIIPGGCTVGTRGIFAAIGMGYKIIHLYGFDSCVWESEHHSYQFATKEERIGELTEISLDVPGGKKYLCAGYMLAQIFEFQQILKMYAGKIEFKVFGGGPLSEILNFGEEQVKEQLKVKDNGNS